MIFQRGVSLSTRSVSLESTAGLYLLKKTPLPALSFLIDQKGIVARDFCITELSLKKVGRVPAVLIESISISPVFCSFSVFSKAAGSSTTMNASPACLKSDSSSRGSTFASVLA